MNTDPCEKGTLQCTKESGRLAWVIVVCSRREGGLGHDSTWQETLRARCNGKITLTVARWQRTEVVTDLIFVSARASFH